MECDCYVEILAAKEDASYRIIHCPLHASAERMKEALKPFAALDIDAFDHLRNKPDDRVVYRMNETFITLEDIRRARAALEGKK